MKEFSEIKKEVEVMEIAEETDLAFKAACVILYALNNHTWNMRRIHYATGFTHTDVKIICKNLRENEILNDANEFQMEDPESEDSWMEFILICLAASGEIIRVPIDRNGIEVVKVPPPKRKPLNKFSKMRTLAKEINNKLIFWEEDVRPLPPLEEEISIPDRTKEKQEPYVFYIPKLDYQ